MNLQIFTVLMVEDFAADRELYRRSLGRDSTCGYELLEAESVAAGLALCRARSIDAILLDYLLPDGDGLEFLSALSVQSNGNIPPVMMMTGKGNESTAVSAMKLGAEDYLVKRDLTPALLQLKVRKAIENARLRQQQQQQERQAIAIWESMTDAYATLDRDWRVVYTNPAAIEVYRQTTGLVPAEYLGKSHWDLFPATVGTIVEREYRRAVAEAVAVHFELFYAPTETWFEVHAYPSAEGLGLYFRDITDRKRDEMARLAAERERDRFFNLSIDLLVVADFDGYFVRVNPVCESILGFTPAEMMAQPFLDFVHADDRAATAAAAKSLSAGNVVVNFENRYRCKDGSYRWILWSAIPDDERNLIYTSGHDITDRKIAELNDRFLYQLTQRLRQLTAAEEIQWETVKSLGEYLDVDRATWFEVDLERGLATSDRDWHRDGFTSLVGTYPIADFVLPQTQAALSAGNLVAIHDVTTDSSIGSYRARYQQMGVGAFVSIPCIEEGRWVATLNVNTATARNWREDEIDLLQTVVTQLWSSIAQARAVAALRAQEQQTRAAQAIVEQQLGEIESIYRAAPIGLSFISSELKFVRINDRLAQINGLAVAEHIGLTIRAVVPELADTVEPVYQQVIESGQPIFDLEVSGSTAAQPGMERHWLACYYPQTDASGRVVGVNTMVQEITERKRLERERQDATQERDRFFNLSIDLLAIGNLDGYFLRLNPAWEQVLGFTTAELMAQPFSEFVHPEDRHKLEVSLETGAKAGSISTNFENRYRCKDGSYRWLSWSTMPYPEQNLMYGIARDVTERKIAERRLQESEQRLRTGVELAGVGLAKFDYATNLVELSPEAAVLYGFAPETTTITRAQIHDTFHPDERAELEEVIAQAIDPAGTGWLARDHRVVWLNGEVRCLSVRKQVFFDRSGAVARPSYAILAAIDITARQQNQADLEQRNRELDSFVYVVSHDLKAPLRAVANLSQWIEDDLEGQLTADSQSQMTQLRSRVTQMSATIDGLLDYARIGRSEDAIEPVALSRLLADVIDSVAPPPTFTIALPAELPTLSTKRLPLFQVLVNLVGNGVKHHHSEAGKIQIALAERGNWYEFTIADDGLGIAPEQHERIFEIFQAVNPQKRSDSTGIGLAIVKKIVEAEGGTIRLESQLGKGTTFYFTWPKRS